MRHGFLKFFFFFLILCQVVLGQDAYRPLRGGIPLQYGGHPATDLVFKDRVLLPEEAHQLYLTENLNTRGRWTLAELDPSENDLWKNAISLPHRKELDDLPVSDQLDEVSFVSYSLTRLENYRFTVSKDHSFFSAYMGTTVHNFLLRKNLLRKLGYEVPAIKYIKSLKVEFKSTEDRDEFLMDFQATVGRDIEDRWITSAPEGASYFYAQDLIIMEDQTTIPNLAVGYVDEGLIDGKRILNSLLLPYAITDLPESINMFSWAHGRIYSENVLLPYENGEVFSCSRDDGVWMARRILALTEKDWEEVVENAHLPPPVAAILLEKLKSRRNHLASLFRIKGHRLPVNDNYTDQDRVVKDGKLQQEFFEGYGRRFKMADPDSPLSFGEILALLKTKGLNKGIELLVTAFNSTPFTEVDVDSKITAVNEEIFTQAEERLREGRSLKGLVKSYVYPTVSGRLLLSRDIVAGSYLGTDNLIQLVDTVGVSINAGAVAGVGGVFTKTGPYAPGLGGAGYEPVSVAGSGSVSFTRSYAHVKPITSIKKALRYPFKNILIPLLKRDQGKTLLQQANLNYDEINALAEAERTKEYERILEAINEKLEVGESIIITDSVVAGAALESGLNLYGVSTVRGRLGLKSTIISRLHILRKSKSVIQIYKDLGNNNGGDLSFGLSKIVPILKLEIKKSKGLARTKFYNVELTPSREGFRKKLLALAGVIKSNSLSLLNKEQKPYVVDHSFTEASKGAGLFVFRWNAMNSVDSIIVKDPTGGERSILRRYKGSSRGVDYESYVQDLFSILTSKILKTNFATSGLSSSNAGFTYYGKAHNKIQVFEGQVDDEGALAKPYSRLTRIWNGWQIGQKKALKTLTKIKDRYRFNFLPEEVLAQTKKFFLYNFNVNLYVHKEGVVALAAKSGEEMKAIFLKHQSRDMTNFTGDDALRFSGLQTFLKHQKRYQREIERKDLKSASNSFLKMVSVIESKLTVDGYELAFGGKHNFLLLSRIEGFRIGDENGDQALTSSTFGVVGNEHLGGPSAEILEYLRYQESEAMTEGEFYVNWLIGRII